MRDERRELNADTVAAIAEKTAITTGALFILIPCEKERALALRTSVSHVFYPTSASIRCLTTLATEKGSSDPGASKQVRFGYTLSVFTLAGPIRAENERLRFGSVWPIGPPEVVGNEDRTAPYQKAPQELH